MLKPRASFGLVMRFWAATGAATRAVASATRASGFIIGVPSRQGLRGARPVGPPQRRIGDPQLLEIRVVARRIVVVLPHLGPVLLHRPRVQLDRGPVLGTHQRLVLHGLRLDAPAILPLLLPPLLPEHEGEP